MADNELRHTFLHRIGDAFREVLTAIPLPVVQSIFVAFLVALLVWVIRLPRERVAPPAGEPAGWSSHLKLWASVALVIQIAIYLIWG